MDASSTPSEPQPLPPTPKQVDAKALARHHRETLRRRTRRIRRTVAGSTAALFSAAFITVSVQLASGGDPALSTKTSASSSTTLTQSARTGMSSGSTGTEAPTATTSAPTTSSQPSAVTTSQS